jgi:hypothetical protein
MMHMMVFDRMNGMILDRMNGMRSVGGRELETS